MFNKTYITVEEDHTYTIIDKKKGIIICNACKGAGKKPYSLGVPFLTTCSYCNGKGTLKLNPPNVQIMAKNIKLREPRK